MDGRMGGWMDIWIHIFIDIWMDVSICIHTYLYIYTYLYNIHYTRTSASEIDFVFFPQSWCRSIGVARRQRGTSWML